MMEKIEDTMEQLVKANEVGRDVVASVSASVLSSVICELVSRFQNVSPNDASKNLVLVRYNERFQLEIHKEKSQKSKEDEGFVSDDEEVVDVDDGMDCTDSDGERICCLSQDHVFKLRKKISNNNESGRGSSFSNNDGVLSSGVSDNDDIIETARPVTSQCWIQRFSIRDILFCHTESRFSNIIAWVVKRKKMLPFDVASRLGKNGVEHFAPSDNCLSVIVIRCQSPEDFSILCEQYREANRRIKLDQYKSINRKKPIILTCLTDTSDLKVSLSDIKVTHSNLLKASELSLVKPKLILPGENEQNKCKISVSLNALFKADAISDEKKLLEDALKSSASVAHTQTSRFNLLQRTDFDGLTHSEVAKANKSKIQKEIEGVILSQMDSPATTIVRRQRCSPSILPGSKAIHWALEEKINRDKPPQRPERRKYLREKPRDGMSPIPHSAVALPDPQPKPIVKSKSKFYLPVQCNSELVRERMDTVKSSSCFRQLANDRISRKNFEYGEKRVDRKCRVKSTGRNAATTPMAYRYIDVNVEPVISSPATMRRDQNNSVETIQVKLKPVIKTNGKISQDKFFEPKKVTFSAYATVQVVN